MGHPKKLRKKYESPKKPFEDLESERAIMNEFGLSTKRELWRFETELRDVRRRARAIQAKKESGRGKPQEEETTLINKLNSYGLEITSLEDVLRLSLPDILSRRLQTIIFKKGYGNTIFQARQYIVHGHVKLNGKRIKFPASLISKEQESMIECNVQQRSGANLAGSESIEDAKLREQAEADSQKVRESMDQVEEEAEKENKQEPNEIV